MMIVDSHLDLAMNALFLKRDLRVSAHELRDVERAAGRTGNGLGRATTGLPDMRRGGVGLSFVTVLARVNPAGTSFLDFATPEIAHAQGQGQLAWYLELERQGVCRLIRSRADLEGHLTEWASPSPPTQTLLPIPGEGEDMAADASSGEGRTKAPSPPAPLPLGEGGTALPASTPGDGGTALAASTPGEGGTALAASTPGEGGTALPASIPGEGSDLPLGFVLSMEGADPIVGPDQLGAWVDQGLRIVSLAHYGPSRYAHGTKSEGGLFPMGRELLAEMARLGVALDVTHLSDGSFREALDLFDGPVLATHSNCRALVPGDRQLSDGMIRELVTRGAVIGSALDAWMLQPGWVIGETTPEGVSMETFVDHIDHVCQIAGDARHAAIGSDLDGGYGTEQTPRDLDTIADLRVVPELLARRGYGDEDIALVMHGNWERWLRGVLPATG